MDALAVVVPDVSSHEMAVFLTLSISAQLLVQTLNFGKMLLGSSQSITQNLEAPAVVLPEISSRELRSNLAFFLTFSISKPLQFRRQILGKCC